MRHPTHQPRMRRAQPWGRSYSEVAVGFKRGNVPWAARTEEGEILNAHGS